MRNVSHVCLQSKPDFVNCRAVFKCILLRLMYMCWAQKTMSLMSVTQKYYSNMALRVMMKIWMSYGYYSENSDEEPPPPPEAEPPLVAVTIPPPPPLCIIETQAQICFQPAPPSEDPPSDLDEYGRRIPQPPRSPLPPPPDDLWPTWYARNEEQDWKNYMGYVEEDEQVRRQINED